MNKFIKEAPGVLPFLPLFYVGWADSVLSPSEVNLIRKKINEISWLSANEKSLLHDWSDPKNPPSDELFRLWMDLIRETKSGLDSNEKQSLADLGLQMASAGAHHHDRAWSNEEARTALEDIEQVMGLNARADFRDLFSKEQLKVETEKWLVKPAFDVQLMAQVLDGAYYETKNKIRLLLEDPVFRIDPIPVKEDYREKVLAWCKLLGQQGLGAMAYPEAYGGRNNIAEYAGVFEVLGFHDLSLAIKFGVQFGLFGGSVYWLGTKSHHDKYLKTIGTMELPGCFAMTETGHGSNVKDIKTTATYSIDNQEFVINTPSEDAQKEYIGNALHGQMATVFAQLYTNDSHYGVHAFVVPLRDASGTLLPGVEVEDCGYKLGLNGVDNGKIRFHNVHIPRENLLNQFANVDAAGNYSSPIASDARRFFTMLGTLVGGRVAVPKAGLSAAKVAISIAILYGLKRRQFGPENQPETLLMDYPTHQKRLMPLLAKAYALSFALEYATNRFGNRTEEDAREIETLAAGLKAYSTWFTTKAIQECREACGGKGYLFENRFAALKADSDIFTTFEGDNTVLMQLTAKGLLTEFKEEIHDFGLWDWIGFLAERVGDSFREVTISDYTGEGHLRDSHFQLEALRFREREILLAVGKRLKQYRSRGMDGYDAYLRCQTHMVDLAHAFVERIVLEQFVLAIGKIDDQNIKNTLGDLKDLFALSTLQNGIGWFMEKEVIAPVKAKAIRKMIEKLCLQTRHQARFLVEAFKIPEQSLAAPIIF